MTPEKNALDEMPDPFDDNGQELVGQFRDRTLAWLAEHYITIRAALQAAQVPAEYRIADQSMAEAYQELFGMLCELKSPPLHSEMNDIINLVLKHWRNK